jgi:rubrerythrin
MRDFVEIAIKDEETGEAFYKALGEMTKKESLKAKYLEFADQENRHKRELEKILGGLVEHSKREDYPGQYEEFMRLLLETRAFSTPEKAAEAVKSLKSDRDALEHALRMEKDTLLFYYEMRDFIPHTHQEIFDKIIAEEKNHVKDLSQLLLDEG